jgi:hypothetical protein
LLLATPLPILWIWISALSEVSEILQSHVAFSNLGVSCLNKVSDILYNSPANQLSSKWSIAPASSRASTLSSKSSNESKIDSI